jgi:hypothetical protein
MGEAQQWTPLAERIIENGLYGFTAGAVIFVIGLIRERWYMRAHFQEVARQRDAYKSLYETATDNAKTTLGMLAEVLEKLEERH